MREVKGFLCYIALPLAAVLALSVSAPAQFSDPEISTTPVHNTAPLRPPAGARVAIVEWEDLECPDCARANGILLEAVKKYNIPLVRHDFPLPFHVWSFQAAVDARWFDMRSKRVGDAFRDALFAEQPTIRSQEGLRRFAVRFAEQHHLRFPMVVDPKERMTALVKADYALGQSVGIRHTPTIWVVTNRKSSAPFVEVVDRPRLFTMIDEALRETAQTGH